MDAAVLKGAFADPARASQAAFRTVMAALAEPGTVGVLPTLAEPPQPLSAGAGTLLLALTDGDTPVLIDPAFGDLARRWTAFHTGAPMVEGRGSAHFAVLPHADLSGFSVGSDTYPDRSATVIAPARFTGPALTLSGPGIQDTRTVHVAHPPDFLAQWTANHALFPRGVDLILVDGARVLALPRSTRIAAAGEDR